MLQARTIKLEEVTPLVVEDGSKYISLALAAARTRPAVSSWLLTVHTTLAFLTVQLKLTLVPNGADTLTGACSTAASANKGALLYLNY